MRTPAVIVPVTAAGTRLISVPGDRCPYDPSPQLTLVLPPSLANGCLGRRPTSALMRLARGEMSRKPHASSAWVLCGEPVGCVGQVGA